MTKYVWKQLTPIRLWSNILRKSTDTSYVSSARKTQLFWLPVIDRISHGPSEEHLSWFASDASIALLQNGFFICRKWTVSANLPCHQQMKWNITVRLEWWTFGFIVYNEWGTIGVSKFTHFSFSASWQGTKQELQWRLRPIQIQQW